MIRLRFIALLLLAPLLGGCEWQTFKSSVAGSCGVFERPPYVVLGKTRYDQDVADKFVESGVAGCNWHRPAARPAALDAKPAQKAMPAKRRGVVARVKAKVQDRVKSIWPAPSAVPLAPLPEPAPVSVPEPAPPPKPRSAIDELLDPDRAARP